MISDNDIAHINTLDWCAFTLDGVKRTNEPINEKGVSKSSITNTDIFRYIYRKIISDNDIGDHVMFSTEKYYYYRGRGVEREKNKNKRPQPYHSFYSFMKK